MSEVLIDDSSLNAIAHSIRRKNGLLRTYKPREMAPAIRAFNDFIPDAHSFTVTVQQSPHQTIRVRKYLDADHKEYTNTFTVSEPYYKAEITVEADGGYIAGQPNYESPITIDRDMVISATPAIESNQQQSWLTLYISFYYDYRFQSGEYLGIMYDRPENVEGGSAVQIDYRDQPNTQRVRILEADRVAPMSYGHHSCGYFKRAEELDVSGINVSGRVDLSYFMSDCPLLRKTDVSHFNTEDTTNLSGFFYNCPQLRTFGNISLWKTSNLLYCNDFFGGNQYIESIDLSGWEVPILKECSNMFNSMILCKVIDISNWSTSQIERVFSLPAYLEYLIMDKEEIKFPNIIFGNNTRTKYLVPSNMVNLYKEHANWQSRASQIDSIDNYTITRYGGQVFVTPNN